MAKIIAGLVGLAGGYVLGAGIGAGLVALLSNNTHDKGQEIAMTAIFFAGPVGGVVGLVAALLGRRTS